MYDSSSNANISTYTPTRKGYDFDGWYTDETGGTKVYNADGSAVNGTQYWQNNVYQNIEGTNILRGDAGQNMAENLFYGEGGNAFKGRIIDNGWVNDSFLNYGKCKKITISPAPIEDNSYRGTFVPVLDNYCNRVSQSIEILRNKKAMISFKIKSDTPMAFEYWGLESTSTGSPYVLKTDSEWKMVTLYAPITDVTLSNNTPRSLAFYTTSSTGTYYIGDVSITLDTDIELFAHWTKKNYSTGTVLNIEGSDYIVMSQTDDGKYLVVRKESVGNRAFQSSPRSDSLNFNTYEGSEIDNYLENNWYNALSSTMKSAIQPINIKQASYSDDSPDTKQETGYNGQIYNKLKRHVYLPSVDEIGKAVDLTNADKVKTFLNGTSIWTRDSLQRGPLSVETLNADDGCLQNNDVYMSYGVQPSFVIDLSKIDYTVTGSVNYK